MICPGVSRIVLILLVVPACAAGGGSSTDPSGSGGVVSGGGTTATGGVSASGGAIPTGGADSGGATTGGAAGASGGTAGASGGTAGASGGGAGAGGSGGVGGADAGCVDPGPEPNDSVVLAIPACGTPSCDIGDCDNEGSTGYGGPRPSIKGVVQSGDLDHFRFDGKDNYGLCAVNAVAKTKDSGFRMCLFVSCDFGASKVSACPGGLAAETNGAPGCCVYAPGEAKITYDCSGSPSDDDSARITVRIDQATSCTPYVVDYHF